MDSATQQKPLDSNQEQQKESVKDTIQDKNNTKEPQEDSQKTEQKELNENKKEADKNNQISQEKQEEPKNSLFSGNFQFDKNKISMNLFMNNKSQISKPEKEDPNKEESEDNNEQSNQPNKKIDNSNNQEKQENSIFGNANISNVFSGKNFFGKQIPSQSLFDNSKNQKSIFDQNTQSIFNNKSAQQQEQTSLFQTNKVSIFDKGQNMFEKNNVQQTEFFEKNNSNALENEPEKEIDFQTKFKTTQLEKVEQEYPFEKIISQKIEKFKQDDNDAIEGGVLSLEKSKENNLHFIILRSLNKMTHHNSIFLKNFSVSKISEKNPILLMIKTFKIKQANPKDEVEKTKNIEKDEKEENGKEETKPETESKHHFLKVKFNQPDEAKSFQEALLKVIENNQQIMYQFQKFIISNDAPSPDHQLQDPTNQFNAAIIRIATKQQRFQ